MQLNPVSPPPLMQAQNRVKSVHSRWEMCTAEDEDVGLHGSSCEGDWGGYMGRNGVQYGVSATVLRDENDKVLEATRAHGGGWRVPPPFLKVKPRIHPPEKDFMTPPLLLARQFF